MASLVIVEDDPDKLTLFRARLTQRGHQLTELTLGGGLLEIRDGGRRAVTAWPGRRPAARLARNGNGSAHFG